MKSKDVALLESEKFRKPQSPSEVNSEYLNNCIYQGYTKPVKRKEAQK